jgi:hypothetical protein
VALSAGSLLVIRLNTVAENDRWSHMGRLIMLQQVGTVTDKRNLVNKDSEHGSRFQRAAAHAVNHLQWVMQLCEQNSLRSNRNQHLFERPSAGLLLDSDTCTSDQTVVLTSGTTRVSHDCWIGWGADAIPRHVHIYTDGSHDAHSKPAPPSSWAVTVADRWLDDNFNNIPIDERFINSAYVGPATACGANINITTGVYPAELRAISHALAMFPLFCSLTFIRTARHLWLVSEPTPMRSTVVSDVACQLVLCCNSSIIN